MEKIILLTSINVRAAPKKGQQGKQSNEELKVLFNAIDQIKSDLSSCGKSKFIRAILYSKKH